FYGLRELMKLRPALLPTLLLACATAHASTNSWINTGDGMWRAGSNWSSNQPPSTVWDTIEIANADSKVVLIDTATLAENLSINKLSLWAPAGFTNTLQLTDLTTNRPLQLSNTLTMDLGGALSITNSALAIDGALGGAFNIRGGSVTLDDGLIDCSTVFLRVGRVSNGSLTVRKGTVEAYELFVGELSGSQGTLRMDGGEVSVTALLSLGDTVNSTGTAS